MNKKLIIFCLALTFALVSTSYGQTVLGNFEDSNDGWGKWVSPAVTNNPNQTYGNSIGVTLGSGSGFVPLSGYSQILARDFNGAELLALTQNDTFSMDFATGSVGEGPGAWIVEEIVLNNPGYGFVNPFVLGYGVASVDSWSGAPIGRPIHVEIKYDPALIAYGWGYCQIIIALNCYDTAHDFYFDRAVLTPEPATIALLGLGGLALLRRKRA